MSDGRQVISELRANMVDVLSYLVPGGTLLVLILHLAYPNLRVLPGWQNLGRADLMQSGWLSFLAVLGVLGVAYILGTLLKTIDSWFGPKWDVVLDCAVGGRMRDIKTALIAALPNSLGDLREPAEKLDDDINAKLHNVADVLVRSHASGALLPWQERHEALQNLYGGLAWALWIGTGAIAVSSVGRGKEPDLWLLLLALPAVAWRVREWSDREKEWCRRCLRKLRPRVIRSLCKACSSLWPFAILLFVLYLAVDGSWLRLAVLAAATLGDELKRRQWAMREKQYNIMWHAALLILRPMARR